MLFAITACNSNTPEKSLEKMLNALKKGDLETLVALQGNEGAANELSDEEKDLYKAMYGNLKFKIGKAEIEDEKATVEIEVTMIDMSKIMTKTMTEAMKGNVTDVNAYMEDLIKDKNAETTTLRAKVPMELKDGKWVIDQDGDTTDFLNAITGGMMSSLGGLG